MPDLQSLRDDLGFFARMVGVALAEFQREAFRLESRITAVVAPRQSGKSRALGVLALWWAYRKPGQRVLIVSAGEEAAKRLLADVRRTALGSALLSGSVIDETAGLLRLSNGSEIRSVPASERQIRGWSTDLLLIDEAVLVSDDLILGAAFPTTAARPDARIVLASSASTAAGAFYDHVMLGLQGSEFVRTFRWSLGDCEWISPTVIAAARESMTEVRFAAEYLGDFASGADAAFPRHVIDHVLADFRLFALTELGAYAGMAGVDWGATTDRSTLVSVARLEPSGAFGVVCAHAWRSGEPLAAPGGVVDQIAGLPARFEQVSMETNGLGHPLAAELSRRLRLNAHTPKLVSIHTTADLKSATYGALRMLFERGQLLLPESATELVRELLLLRVTLTQQGGERIEAGVGHDDLADGLMLATGPYQDTTGKWRTRLGDAAERAGIPTSVSDIGDTVLTGGGLRVPRTPQLQRMGFEPSITRERYRDEPGEPEYVLDGGGMTLVGEHHMDIGPGGVLVPPPGFQRRR